jgi:L-alanine-DL-glutamate epimerase-like enolase superfamily enzyme
VEISKIKIAECCVPLPKILRLGPVEISSRDYVVIRVETNESVHGEAIGYPRGTPLFETVGNMARRLMGKEPQMRRQLMVNLEQSNIPGRGALTRGLSLMDIALWDIACKQARQPLYQFIGGLRTAAEVTTVVGYYIDQRSIADVVDEIGRLEDSGCRRVKIMLKGDDPAFDQTYAAAATGRMPGCVAADAHWSWNTLTEAKRTCRILDDLGLIFLEDPFAASDVCLTHELRRDLVTPIAAGEDVFGPRVISDLAAGIDILRVDATTVGGITGAIEAIHIANAAGKTVFPHVFGPLHVHFACAFPNVESVELITAESGADPLHRLLRNVPIAEGGKLSPSSEPGVGISVDWDAVGKLSRRHAVIDAGI